MDQHKNNPNKTKLNNLSDYRFLILIILGTTTLILGYIGFAKNGQKIEADRTVLDNLYLLLGLFSMNSGSVPGPVPWELQLARFAVPALTGYAAFITFAALFSYQMSLLKLWFIKDHVVICGLGKKGLRLVEMFRSQDYRIVAIDKDPNHPDISSLRSKGVIVLTGNASDPVILIRSHINKSQHLISTIGDEGQNIEVALQAEKITNSRKKGILNCSIHVSDPTLWDLLRDVTFKNNSDSKCRINLFNTFEQGAALMLNEGKAFQKEDDANKYVILGLGKLGQAIITQAAHRHFYSRSKSDPMLQFTLIDIHAEQKLEYLKSRYPYLNELCKYETLNCDVNSSKFISSLPNIIQGETIPTCIFICMDQDSLNLQTGFTINRISKGNLPIILRFSQSSGLSNFLDSDSILSENIANLHPFHLLEETCTSEIIIHGTTEILAKLFYDIYSLDQKEVDQTYKVQAWNNLPEEEKEKNRQQTDRICQILSAHDYKLAPLHNVSTLISDFPRTDLVSMAKMEHDIWRDQKIEAGWVYAKTKSNRKKTSPAIAPWDSLPKTEQDKNIKFIKNLPDSLLKAGYQIEKQAASN